MNWPKPFLEITQAELDADPALKKAYWAHVLASWQARDEAEATEAYRLDDLDAVLDQEVWPREQ